MNSNAKEQSSTWEGIMDMAQTNPFTITEYGI